MQIFFKFSLILVIICLFTIYEVKSEFKDWRIIGGVKANRGEFPHQLLIMKHNFLECSASLINDRWVLTAAHCMTINVGPKLIPEVKSKENLTIRIGEYNIEESDSEKFDVNIKQIIVHPKWNFTKKQNDIALIELSQKINYTQNIRNIELANSSDHLEGQMCTISGWGETGTEGETIFIRKANIPILDNKRCDKEWKEYDMSRNRSLTQIFEGQICAGDLPDVSTCHGDSGGPLQCIVSGHKLLVGIVSFGNIYCNELNGDLSQIPNVYTRISYYYDWILSHIQSN